MPEFAVWMSKDRSRRAVRLGRSAIHFSLPVFPISNEINIEVQSLLCFMRSYSSFDTNRSGMTSLPPLITGEESTRAQAENVLSHRHIVKNIPAVEVNPAPDEFDALPFVAHENAVHKGPICLAIRKFLRISGLMIRRIDGDTAWLDT